MPALQPRSNTVTNRYVFPLQVTLSSQRLPQILATVKNITSRLQPYQYLQNQGLYSALSLRQLVQELSQLRTDVGQIHSQMNNAKTQKLFEEVKKKKKNLVYSHRSFPMFVRFFYDITRLQLTYWQFLLFDRWMDWVNMWRGCKRQTSSTWRLSNKSSVTSKTVLSPAEQYPKISEVTIFPLLYCIITYWYTVLQVCAKGPYWGKSRDNF